MFAREAPGTQTQATTKSRLAQCSGLVFEQPDRHPRLSIPSKVRRHIKVTAAVVQRLCGGTVSHVALENNLSCKLKQTATAAGAVLLCARRGAKITPRRLITRVPTTLHVRVRVLQIGMIEDVLCLGPELELYPLPNADLLEDRCIHICKTGTIQRISPSVAVGKLRRIGKRRTINARATGIMNVEVG